MKKMMAGIIAVALSVCSFTSCGSKSSGSSNTDSKAESSVSESSQAENNDIDTAQFETLLNGFTDAVAANDNDKVMELLYPPEIVEGFKVKFGDDWDAYKDSLLFAVNEKVGTIEIKKVLRMKDEDMKSAQEGINQLAAELLVNKTYTIKEAYSIDCIVKKDGNSVDKTMYAFNIDDNWCLDIRM